MRLIADGLVERAGRARAGRRARLLGAAPEPGAHRRARRRAARAGPGAPRAHRPAADRDDPAGHGRRRVRGRVRQRAPVQRHRARGLRRAAEHAAHGGRPAPPGAAPPSPARWCCGCRTGRRSTPTGCWRSSPPGRSTASRPSRTARTGARCGCRTAPATVALDLTPAPRTGTCVRHAAARRPARPRPRGRPAAPAARPRRRPGGRRRACSAPTRRSPRASRAAPGIRLPGTVDGVETALRAVLGPAGLGGRGPHGGRAGWSPRSASALPPALLQPAGRPGPARSRTPAAIAERGAEVLTGPARRIATVLGLAARAGRRHARARRRPRPRRAARRADRAARHRTVDRRLPGHARARRPGRAAGHRPRACAAAPPRSASRPIADGLTAAGERWAPWRSYAATHLWRARAPPPPRTGGHHEHRTWSTIGHPVGPFTAVVDGDGAVLASGWTADARTSCCR